MHSIMLAALALIVFGVATIIGVRLRRRLDLMGTSKDMLEVIKLGIGVVSAMSAVLLGFMVSSSRVIYEESRRDLAGLLAEVTTIDAMLSVLGTSTMTGRDRLREAALDVLDSLENPRSGTPGKPMDRSALGQVVLDTAATISGESVNSQLIKRQIFASAISVSRIQWSLFEKATATSSLPLLVIVILCLALVFMASGYVAGHARKVILLVSLPILASATAIFFIAEVDQPFDGTMQIDRSHPRQLLSENL